MDQKSTPPTPTLIDYMSRPLLKDRLVVTPLLDAKAVGAASIDVRLGNQFIIMKREALAHIDAMEMSKIHQQLGRYQQRIVKSYEETIVIHPRQLLIGSTLEYVKLPSTLMCYVIGKSSWGRLGLIIATATKVDPGFTGCITLEIVNDGEVPLVLRPNTPIAQLVFHPSAEGIYDGRYKCPVGPEFPKF